MSEALARFHADTTPAARRGLRKLCPDHGEGNRARSGRWAPDADDPDIIAARAWLNHATQQLALQLARLWMFGPDIHDPDLSYVADPDVRVRLQSAVARHYSEHARGTNHRDVLRRMAAGEL